MLAAQIEARGARCALGAEERIVQFRRAVAASRENVKGVLGIVGTPASATANTDTGVDLETGIAAIRVEQLDGHGPFPILAALFRICVDA